MNTIRTIASKVASSGLTKRPTGIFASTSRWQASSSDTSADEMYPPKRRLDPSSASNLMEIGTRRIFNEDHDMFRESCRRFFNEEVLPHQMKYERQGYADREIWLKAGANGLLGVDTPIEYGGGGGTILDAAIIWEEQVYINEQSCGYPLHSNIVMPYILHYGTEEQKQKYLPKMASGEWIGCLGMTEPGAGSDVQGIRTYAKRDGDDFILNGSKVFITNGWHADVAVIVAVTNPDAKHPAHGMSLFIVEKGMPGFTKGNKPLEKMGLKGQDTAELFFDDVRLSKDHLLGEFNRGFIYNMTELPQERILIGVAAQASCEWMFETTRDYVKQRKAFGKTVSALQTVQHKLAEMKTKICVNRAHTDQCLQALYEGVLDSEAASMNKYWTADLCVDIADTCVQMHGGWGYMYEYGICRAFTAARLQPIYGGTNEIMKELIARSIVKK